MIRFESNHPLTTQNERYCVCFEWSVGTEFKFSADDGFFIFFLMVSMTVFSLRRAIVLISGGAFSVPRTRRCMLVLRS